MATESLVFKVSATGVRQVQTSLKAIGTSADKAATSVAKLSQSMALISKNSKGIRQVSTELNAVSAAAKKTQASANGVAASFKKISAAGSKLGAAAAGMNKNVAATNKLTKASNAAGVSMTRLRTIFIALGGALVLRAAIRTLAGFEQQMASVKAISGATGKEFAALERSARLLGATTVFTATQAAEGLKFLSLAGLRASESMRALPGTLQLAQAGALDLGRAADIATNVLTGFQLAATEMANVSDILSTAQARSNTNVSQLGEALKLVAPVARAFGANLTDVTAVLGKMGDAGLQGSIAGTGLRRVLTSLADQTPKTLKILDKYGVSQDDVNVKTQGLIGVLDNLVSAGIGVGETVEDAGDAMDLFGQRGGVAFLAVANGVTDIEELAEVLRESAGNGERFAFIMGATLVGAFRVFKSAVSEAVLQLGEAGLLSGLKNVLNSAAGVISIWNGMGDAFAESNELTKKQKDSLEDLAVTLGRVKTAVTLLAIGISINLTGALGARLLGRLAAATAGMNLFRVATLAITKVFGGVWGLAIATAITAWGFLSNAMDEAAIAAGRVRPALEDVATAIKQVGEASDTIERVQILSPVIAGVREQGAELRGLLSDLETTIEAEIIGLQSVLSKTIPDFEARKIAIRVEVKGRYIEELTTLSDLISENDAEAFKLAGSLANATGALRTFSDGALTAADKLSLSADELDRWNKLQSDTADILSNSSSALDRAVANLDAASLAQRNFTDGLREGIPLTEKSMRAQELLAQATKLAFLEYRDITTGFVSYVDKLALSNKETDKALGLWLRAKRDLRNYEDSIGGVNDATVEEKVRLVELNDILNASKTALDNAGSSTEILTDKKGELALAALDSADALRMEEDAVTSSISGLQTLTETQIKLRSSAIESGVALARQNDALFDASQTVRELAEQERILSDTTGLSSRELAQQAIALRAVQIESAEARFKFQELNGEVGAFEAVAAGAKRGARDFFTELGTLSERTATLVNSGIGTMRDTLADFFKTGKFDADDFWGSMRDLAADFFANELVALAGEGQSTLLNFFSSTREEATATGAVMIQEATKAFDGTNAKATESQGVLQTVFGLIRTGAETLWTGVSTAATFAWNLVTSGSNTTQQAVGGDFGTMAAAGTSMFTGLTTESTGFWAGFQRLASAGRDFLLSVWDTLKGGALTFIDAVSVGFDNFFRGVQGDTTQFSNSIPGIIGVAIGALGGSIVGAVSKGIDLVTTGFNIVKGLFFADGGMVEGFAGGGKIRGPGSGTSDSIPAFAEGSPIAVSNGEFIINAASTKKFGGLIQAINDNNVPGFADGGFHGGQTGSGATASGRQGLTSTQANNQGPGSRSPEDFDEQDARVTFLIKEERRKQLLLDAANAAARRVTETVAGGFLSVLDISGALGNFVGSFGPAAAASVLGFGPDIPGLDQSGIKGRVMGAIIGRSGILPAVALIESLDEIGAAMRGFAERNGLSFVPGNDPGSIGSGRVQRDDINEGARNPESRAASAQAALLGSFASRANTLGGVIGGASQRLAANKADGTRGGVFDVSRFASGREHGGQAIGGRPFIVGESGPELFVPQGSGQVIPGGGGGGDDQATAQAIDRLTREMQAVRRELAEQTEPIKRTARASDQRRLGGALAGRQAA